MIKDTDTYTKALEADLATLKSISNRMMGYVLAIQMDKFEDPGVVALFKYDRDIFTVTRSLRILLANWHDYIVTPERGTPKNLRQFSPPKP